MADTCQICASERISESFEVIEGYPFMQCHDCGLAWLKEVPPDSDLEKIYEGNDYTERLIERSRRRDRFHQRLVEIIQSRLTSGRVIDVGCGPGYLVRFLHDAGFDAEGIDISEAYARFAEEKLGVKVHKGNFLETDPSAVFDLIIMNQLLEHLAEPWSFVRKAHKLLAPGGLILISTPNLGFGHFALNVLPLLGMRNRIRYLDVFDAPCHLTLFYPGTLTRLLDVTGFETIEVGLYPTFLMRPQIFSPARFYGLLVDAFKTLSGGKLTLAPNFYVLAYKR